MEPVSDRRWVSAWSTSPIDASLSETGVLDRLGVAVTDVSARTAVLLTAGGTHVRLTLSNMFGVLPLHVAACTVAIGADDARGIGAPLIFAMNQYAWSDVSVIFLGFVLLVWLIDAGSARLRTRRAALR